ncbi:hypothetical protein [Leyella stercorea]|uniref:hypothetical protein n=1 Tax=Leyella stercorea TaxID=363265 RepID=UPI003FEE7C2F
MVGALETSAPPKGAYRSTQTSVSVDADIRIGRRRHPHRSAQTSASVGADIRIGRRRPLKYNYNTAFPVLQQY